MYYALGVKIRQDMKQKKQKVGNAINPSWFGESFHYWPPGEFRDRILFWIDKHLEDSPKGGDFIDPEVNISMPCLQQIMLLQLPRQSEAQALSGLSCLIAVQVV